jgi:hypothetical protein
MLQDYSGIIMSILSFMLFLSCIIILIACSSKNFNYTNVINDTNTMLIILFNFIFISLFGSAVIYYINNEASESL